MGGLKERTFRGALYMGGTTLAARVLSVISGIVLARLLDPVQFGLISLCFIVLSVVSLLAPLGLSSALIRYRGEAPQKASFQVFVWVMITGTISFLVVVFTREPLARFLGNPEVSAILPWMATLILIDMLGRVPEALLERDLAFKQMSKIALTGEVLYVAVAVAVSLAATGFGIWSLVIAHLARAASGTFLCILWYRNREWLIPQSWDWQVMKDLLGFGLKSVGSAAVNKFYLNIDNFVVGRELGATALGFYSKAFSFTTANVDNVTTTIGRVLFPTYAKIQHDLGRLTQAYLKSLRMIASTTIPLAFGIAVTAPVLIPALLGAKWAPMVPILQVLALMSVVKPVSATAGSVFNALGMPGRNMTAGIVVSVVMLAGMFVFLGYGAVGIAWAVVTAHVVGYIYNIFQMGRVLPGAAGGMIRTVVPAFISSILTAAAMHAVRIILPDPASDPGRFAVFGAMSLVGIALYGGILMIFQRPLVNEIRALIRPAKTA